MLAEPGMAPSFFTLFFALCVLLPYYTFAEAGVSGGGGGRRGAYPHLTSGLVASGTEIKLYIRYSPRDPSALHTSREVPVIQLLR